MKNKVNEILDDLGVDAISEMEEHDYVDSDGCIRGSFHRYKKLIDKTHELDDTD